MSASIPPRGPWAAYLERTAVAARLVAAFLVTLVSVRFATAGLSHALAASQGNFAPRPAPHGTASSSGPGAPASSGAPATAKESPPPSRSVRVTLGVTAGAPRSEVYVNGRRVGQAPFLGDTACKTGQPLRIEIVPPSGPPLTYERRCAEGTLEISGPPP